MKTAKHFPALTAAAVAAIFFTIAPAASLAITGDDTDVPVAPGEAQARTCYLHAKELWNTTMASAPRDHRQLDTSYRTFANCAKLAISTGKKTRSGERLPWMADYFADTVGATYAQLQLASITENAEHCSHLVLARDLADQAQQTEGEIDTPGSAQFQSMWQALQTNVKLQASACGKTASR
jgi:hypothetical protein